MLFLQATNYIEKSGSYDNSSHLVADKYLTSFINLLFLICSFSLATDFSNKLWKQGVSLLPKPKKYFSVFFDI
jgi:hypothetical protein